MMASTYENMRKEKPSLQFFDREKQIYSLAYRYELFHMMSIFACWDRYILGYINIGIMFYVINLRRTIPVGVDYHSQANMLNYNAC